MGLTYVCWRIFFLSSSWWLICWRSLQGRDSRPLWKSTNTEVTHFHQHWYHTGEEACLFRSSARRSVFILSNLAALLTGRFGLLVKFWTAAVLNMHFNVRSLFTRVPINFCTLFVGRQKKEAMSCGPSSCTMSASYGISIRASQVSVIKTFWDAMSMLLLVNRPLGSEVSVFAARTFVAINNIYVLWWTWSGAQSRFPKGPVGSLSVFSSATGAAADWWRPSCPRWSGRCCGWPLPNG